MKYILLVAFFLGAAFCAPLDVYQEFDIHYAPAEAAQAIPAGVPAGSLEVLLPINAAAGGPVRGFIKQDIPQPNGKDKEVFYPFGFDVPAPAAPAVPAAAPAAAPVAPVAPVVAAAPAAKRSEDDEEEDD